MIDITILLPTRGRRESLRESLFTLARLAQKPQNIEMLLAFDQDDHISADWFLTHVAPTLDDLDVKWTVYSYPRMGYIRLNEYVNSLARRSKGRWLMFWGDDAVMNTQDWDQRICEVESFRVLRMPTHRSHPYAIFPIVPRAWIDVLGYMSGHQLTDSYVSQIAYMLDIMHNIDVDVTHDRFDLTGNNNDETYQNRPMLEGNPTDPRDFNHQNYRERRLADAEKLSQHLASINQPSQWWEDVKASRQDPWARMCSEEQDPNKQIKVFPL